MDLKDVKRATPQTEQQHSCEHLKRLVGKLTQLAHEQYSNTTMGDLYGTLLEFQDCLDYHEKWYGDSSHVRLEGGVWARLSNVIRDWDNDVNNKLLAAVSQSSSLSTDPKFMAFVRRWSVHAPFLAALTSADDCAELAGKGGAVFLQRHTFDVDREQWQTTGVSLSRIAPWATLCIVLRHGQPDHVVNRAINDFYDAGGRRILYAPMNKGNDSITAFLNRFWTVADDCRELWENGCDSAYVLNRFLPPQLADFRHLSDKSKTLVAEYCHGVQRKL